MRDKFRITEFKYLFDKYLSGRKLTIETKTEDEDFFLYFEIEEGMRIRFRPSEDGNFIASELEIELPIRRIK